MTLTAPPCPRMHSLGAGLLWVSSSPLDVGFRQPGSTGPRPSAQGAGAPGLCLAVLPGPCYDPALPPLPSPQAPALGFSPSLPAIRGRSQLPGPCILKPAGASGPQPPRTFRLWAYTWGASVPQPRPPAGLPTDRSNPAEPRVTRSAVKALGARPLGPVCRAASLLQAPGSMGGIDQFTPRLLASSSTAAWSHQDIPPVSSNLFPLSSLPPVGGPLPRPATTRSYSFPQNHHLCVSAAAHALTLRD